jgi:hypothetical protein
VAAAFGRVDALTGRAGRLKLKYSFIIILLMHDTLRPGPCGRIGRVMTHCECAGASFDEVARLMAGGRSFDEAQVETGAGLLCTACLPDLRDRVCRAWSASSTGSSAAGRGPGREPVDPAA